MKKIGLLFLISLFLGFLFTSCKEEDHLSIIEDLRKETDEEYCRSQFLDLASCIGNEENYQWNEDHYDFVIGGELEAKIQSIIGYHQVKHIFTKKNGKFDNKKWNNWMYYVNNSDTQLDPGNLVTCCIVCHEQNNYLSCCDEKNQKEMQDEVYTFLSQIGNEITYEDILDKPFVNKLIEAKKEQLTKIRKEKIAQEAKLNSIGKASIAMSSYLYGNSITINYVYNTLKANKKLVVSRELDGSCCIIKAVEYSDNNIVKGMCVVFKKIYDWSECYISEIYCELLGKQLADGICYGLSDEYNLGYCLSQFKNSLDLMKN